MKTIVFLLFLYSTTITNGQQGLSYIEYHKKCRTAESFFLMSDTLNCFLTYNEIFEKYQLLFPRDCFMAAQFAHKFRNDSLAVEYLLKGIPFGLNPDFFTDVNIETNASYLKELKHSRFWINIEKQKDSLKEIYMQKIDLNLKTELMNLVRIDQNWRKKNNKWFNRNFRPGLEKKFDEYNNQCLFYLDSIFHKKGYPGNWLIGTGDSLQNQTNYASFNTANLGDIVSVILYHSDSAYIQFGDFLYNEINNGHIHPRVYAMIRDFSDRHLVKNDKSQKMYYNIWWEQDNLTEKEFESHCNEIGCPTKQHLRDLSTKMGKGYDVFWSPFR